MKRLSSKTVDKGGTGEGKQNLFIGARVNANADSRLWFQILGKIKFQYHPGSGVE